MLGNYLLFDGEKFPNPITPSMSAKTIENVNTSEAGTDLVVVVRPAKRSWSFTFNLSSRRRDIIREICKKESVTMTYMGTSYSVRVRDFTERLVSGSEWIATTEGLYEVTVKVTEF